MVWWWWCCSILSCLFVATICNSLRHYNRRYVMYSVAPSPCIYNTVVVGVFDAVVTKASL